jgi:hypothetical protein
VQYVEKKPRVPVPIKNILVPVKAIVIDYIFVSAFEGREDQVAVTVDTLWELQVHAV